MRIVTRSLVASAVAVPLLFVGTGAAFASEDTFANVGVDTETSLSASYDSDRYDDNNGVLGDLVGDDDNRYSDNDDSYDDDILGDLLSNDDDNDNNDDILGGLLG
ncbi:hypothetical protein [Pseudonocardia sp.]|uniref:hypothetical protein n=1 Tax=Pseudonocardia sp. TaxID=60912 RepID=UPI003D0F8491